VTWRDRIAQRADLIVTGQLLYGEAGVGIIVSSGLLPPTLVGQKRRGWGEKDAKGSQGGIGDGVVGVGTLCLKRLS
jgi:hypothetical protein